MSSRKTSLPVSVADSGDSASRIPGSGVNGSAIASQAFPSPDALGSEAYRALLHDVAAVIVDYVEGYIFDEDLLCVSEDGANLVARTYPIAFPISGKTWVNNHAHVLRFENAYTQKFVEVYLNSIKLDDFITGMAQPKLNKAMLDRIPAGIGRAVGPWSFGLPDTQGVALGWYEGGPLALGNRNTRKRQRRTRFSALTACPGSSAPTAHRHTSLGHRPRYAANNRKRAEGPTYFSRVPTSTP